MNMNEFKPSKTILHISTEINIPGVQEIRDLLTAKYGNEYNVLTHLTFLLMPMGSEEKDNIETLLDKFLKSNNTKRFTIKTKEVQMDLTKKFFYLPIEGDAVKKLHLELLELCNKYRHDFIREKDYLRLTQDPGYFNGAELTNIKKYGYTRVKNKFEPHITIGNIGAENIREEEALKLKSDFAEKLTNVINKEFTIKKITAFIATESNTTANQKILWEKTYDLA